MADEPIEEYKQQVEKGVIDALPYDRLMVYYRKEKDFQSELKVIKKGISTFKKHFADLQKASVKKKKSKVHELSRLFSKTTGLTDKKGNEIYLPAPLPKWIKRQTTVEQKLKKKKS
ncbi:MAG: hypothetical protein JNK79_12330 [Chitinophagaceae bacterium]|nr:hypothetical protein [Chitinophagaceae bacterium]